MLKWVQQRADFEPTGYRLYFVGHGSQSTAELYMKELSMPRDMMLIDASRSLHKFLQLKTASVLGLLMDAEGRKVSYDAYKSGFGIRMWGTGSITQLGGVAVVRNGEVVYRHLCEAPYDYPAPESILEVLRTVDAPSAAS